VHVGTNTTLEDAIEWNKKRRNTDESCGKLQEGSTTPAVSGDAYEDEV
jgi:hypothetical protein